MNSPQKKICVHMASLKAINIWRYPWDTLVSTPNLHGDRERTFDQKMFFIIQSYFLTFVLSQFITLVFMCELYLLGVNPLCHARVEKKIYKYSFSILLAANWPPVFHKASHCVRYLQIGLCR